MAERTLYQAVDEYDDSADEDPNDIPDVLQKTLLRDEYTTRNMKILFVAFMTLFVGGSLIWILQRPSNGLLGLDMGMFVGYLVMALVASLVITTIISVLVKTVYLGGYRAFSKASH